MNPEGRTRTTMKKKGKQGRQNKSKSVIAWSWLASLKTQIFKKWQIIRNRREYECKDLEVGYGHLTATLRSNTQMEGEGAF